MRADHRLARRLVGATGDDSNRCLFQAVTEEFLAWVDAPRSRAEFDAGLTAWTTAPGDRRRDSPVIR
ncbi:hypothetical protein [Streptomyces canus]|uniref:hypothetical protein n=1 Tax=Streptomyces canus TaxID=58343 RepID=UPI003CE9ED2C